jgi:hypothetical protein
MSRERGARRALLAAALLAGCGSSPGDLIAIEVSGGPAGGANRLVVTSDGRGRCDAGALTQLPSDRLLEAREVERELQDLAEKGAAFEAAPAADRRRYVARTQAGAVRWTEGQPGIPAPLPEAQLLALRLERQLCR